MKQSISFANGFIKAFVEAGTGLLILDNKQRKNAVTAAMWRAIPEAIHWLHVEAEARVIVISGAGTADFSAGADISEFTELRKDTQTARVYEASNSRAFAAIREAPVPMIAAIRGVCYGGGFGLAAATDLRIAASDAVFAVPAARLGLAYPADAVQDFVRGLGSQMARRALYTGAAMKASDLFGCGFLSEITEPDELEQRVKMLADTIAANAPLSLRASKLALRAVEQADDDLLREAEIIGASTFESADYREGRSAFAERRRPVFTGR
ncbi:MAG: enoyl-CoA hydratase/isomerase family protein [Alphaproteobacteria bacterium]|nr:enoyl-CoA hydratase/isomerase family protein [Alphaproteobacteria bacterium]MBU0832241.1 enoyl-CoA hydratase/isomerase family protein [Alphaproteobacteria bacterium]MBU1762834.1 enoyl-CoA hydratase/isomerase family protein [Alphaproteobacteria bacterium]